MTAQEHRGSPGSRLDLCRNCDYLIHPWERTLPSLWREARVQILILFLLALLALAAGALWLASQLGP